MEEGWVQANQNAPASNYTKLKEVCLEKEELENNSSVRFLPLAIWLSIIYSSKLICSYLGPANAAFFERLIFSILRK